MRMKCYNIGKAASTVPPVFNNLKSFSYGFVTKETK